MIFAVCLLLIAVFILVIGLYLCVDERTEWDEALENMVIEVDMMDEYRILDPYKGPTCILTHKMCNSMDCRKCVFALAEKMKETR